MSKNKLVYGFGINDADYVTKAQQTTGYIGGKRKQKLIWICPYYKTWMNILIRSYSEKFQNRNPKYIGCSVCEEWKYFSKFKAWMEQQDYNGKQLDKDLLVPGNRVYSPTTCVFVDARINSFVIECNASRGEYPIGVCYQKKAKYMTNERTKPYAAMISMQGCSRKHLGYFSTVEEAHKAWLKAKLELANLLAAEILEKGGDPRVADALIKRYENYLCEEVRG